MLCLIVAQPASGAGIERHPPDTTATPPKKGSCSDPTDEVACAIEQMVTRCKAHPESCKSKDLTTGDICNVHPELPICQGGEVQS